MQEGRIIVGVFCDYVVPFAQGIWEYPLYCDNKNGNGHKYFEEYRTLCEADVPILHELVQWNIEYDNYYSEFQTALEEHKTLDKYVFDPIAFTETGKRLAFQLKKNHPDWEVRFYDEVSSNMTSYMNGRNDITKNSTHWYSVQISNIGDVLFLPLHKRRLSDNPTTWELYLPNSK